MHEHSAGNRIKYTSDPEKIIWQVVKNNPKMHQEHRESLLKNIRDDHVLYEILMDGQFSPDMRWTAGQKIRDFTIRADAANNCEFLTSEQRKILLEGYILSRKEAWWERVNAFLNLIGAGGVILLIILFGVGIGTAITWSVMNYGPS